MQAFDWYLQGEHKHKKVSPKTFVDISAMRGDLCMKFYRTVKESNIHFTTKFGWNLLESDKLMLFQPRQPPFLSVRASCRTTECERVHWEDCSGPQALQIWTQWTVTSGAPCWKSIINSSRSIRQLMSWKSLCRPCGGRCHENTWTSRWRSSPSDWLPTWQWLPMVVTPSICSNSVRLKVCIIISSPTNWLFSEPPTDSVSYTHLTLPTIYSV